MANYTSFAPSQVATRPFDPSSAMDVGLQDVLARQAQTRDLEAMLIANQQKQAELDRYQAQSPNEIALSNLKGGIARATNPEVMAQGEMGEARKKKLDADKLMQMLKSDVAAGKAENASKAAQARFTQSQAELGQLNQIAQIMSAAPPGSPQSQGLWQQVRSKLPPELAQGLPESWSPQLAQHIQKVLTETPAHLQELAKIAATGSWHKEVANIQGSTARAVAKIGAEAPGKAKESETQRKSAVFQKIGAGTASEGEVQEGLRYLGEEIDKIPEIASYKDALSFEITKGAAGNPQRILDQMNEHKSRIWDAIAPGSLKARNPYKKAPAAPTPGTNPREVMPGVVRKN